MPRTRQDRESEYTTSIYPPNDSGYGGSINDNMGSYRSHRSDSDNDSVEDANVHGARQGLENMTLSPTAPNGRGGSRSPRPSTSQTSFTSAPIAQSHSAEQYAQPTPITEPVPYGGGQYSPRAAVDSRPIAEPYNAGPGPYIPQAAVDRPVYQPYNAGPYIPQASVSNPIPPPQDSSETMPVPAQKKKKKISQSYLHF